MKPIEQCLFVAPPSYDIPPDLRRPEIHLRKTETKGIADEQKICCGYVPIVLMKLYGPLIFADIRITAEAETGDWVIYRQNNKTSEWSESARIPGQIDSEFDDLD